MTPRTSNGPLSRRKFLEVGSVAGAGLLIGFHLPLDRGTDLPTLLSGSDGADGAADLDVTEDGDALLAGFGVDTRALRGSRRRFAASCLDWTERRPHLGGATQDR